MALASWFLTASERGNPATRLDAAHPGDKAWSEGNCATPLIHGANYFGELLRCVRQMQSGDLLLFTDWRGDPDQLLTEDPDTAVARVFCEAAERGVDVRGLVWRSHMDKLAFSSKENRHLGEDIERAGGQCLLDMRVRFGGSHHQKFVVLRHPGRPELDVAFVGGIDLCHSRRDDERHDGDRQRQSMASAYGERPPWHDAAVALRGPAVADVEKVFRERWEDPQPLSRNPIHRAADLLRREDTRGRPLPSPLPPPDAAGDHAVQLLRTYPRRLGGYPFAPLGERSVARGYAKALRQARTLIYLEDQYLWSAEVASTFASALRREPGLHLIAVVPMHSDQDGRISGPPNLIGRVRALAAIREAGADRVAVYCLESPASVPVYVHAKVCVVDDTWATIGSDNVNRRSWTHDSELSAVVCDTAARPHHYARDLRVSLMSEHLGLADGATAKAPASDLVDPAVAFAAMADSADALDSWHFAGQVGPRPCGRLRRLPDAHFGPWRRRWSTVLYHAVYDPDGRPRKLRRARDF